jgi:Zinc finger, C2H2 type/Zinc-finger of C2H2 type
MIKHLFYAHNPNKLSSCDYCDKKFRQKYSRAQHLLHVHGKIDENYKDRMKDCPHCDRKYLGTNLFQTHLKAHALKIRPRKCKFCKEEFPDFNAVVDHQVAAHGRQCFTCAKCNKKFIAASDLRMHERSHSTVSPYICDHCGKTFRRRQDIMEHMATHMRDTFVRCKLCNTGCRNENRLKAHMEDFHSENFNLENLLPKPKRPRRPRYDSQDLLIPEMAPEVPQNEPQRDPVLPQMPASQPHNVPYWSQMHPFQPIMASMPGVTNHSTTTEVVPPNLTNHTLPSPLQTSDNLSANPSTHIPRINLLLPRLPPSEYHGVHHNPHAQNVCALQPSIPRLNALVDFVREYHR